MKNSKYFSFYFTESVNGRDESLHHDVVLV